MLALAAATLAVAEKAGPGYSAALVTVALLSAAIIVCGLGYNWKASKDSEEKANELRKSQDSSSVNVGVDSSLKTWLKVQVFLLIANAIAVLILLLVTLAGLRAWSFSDIIQELH